MDGREASSSRDGLPASAHTISLSGYLVQSDLGHGPRTRTCKVREKPHRDVPPAMDDMEPSFALKCIDLEEGMPSESKRPLPPNALSISPLLYDFLLHHHC